MLVVQKWLCCGPREFLASSVQGSMGYAVPGALRARLVWPDRPEAAFAGDGGVLTAVAKLDTRVREDPAIVVAVFDDEEIGLIRVRLEIKAVARFGVGFRKPDWTARAAGFGADCVVVAFEHGPGDALQAAARIDGRARVDRFSGLREPCCVMQRAWNGAAANGSDRRPERRI